MNNITLKPCPFCGGEAEIRHGGRGSVSKPITSFIACKSCGARTDQVEVDAEYSSDEEAAKAWNSRADSGTEETALPEEFSERIMNRFEEVT